jgi:hypothetical protein
LLWSSFVIVFLFFSNIFLLRLFSLLFIINILRIIQEIKINQFFSWREDLSYWKGANLFCGNLKVNFTSFLCLLFGRTLILYILSLFDLYFFSAPQIVGEISYLLKTSVNASVVADGEAEVYKFEG